GLRPTLSTSAGGGSGVIRLFPKRGLAGMVPKSSTVRARGGMARWHGGVRGTRSPAPKSRSCQETTRVKRGRRLPGKRTVTLRPPKNEEGTLFILCSQRQVGPGPLSIPGVEFKWPLIELPPFCYIEQSNLGDSSQWTFIGWL